MFYVYVLKSLRNGKRYVGFTSKDPRIRLTEHNSGTNAWTRQNKPHKLIYQEFFATDKDARTREKFFKSGQGRKWLDKTIDLS